MRKATTLVMMAACIGASVMLAAVQGKPAPAPTPASPAAPIAKPGEPAKGSPANVAVYDEQADARQQIAAAIASAKKENRRVLIQWGGNWCPWCIMLNSLCKSDKDIRKELSYEYDVVHIDAGRPKDKNVDLALSYGADVKTHGFPFLTILDADGKPIANQETSSLENKNQDAAKGHDPKLVLEFLTKNQAPALDAQKLLDAALVQAAQSDKRIFMHFGAPWCGWCHVLEDWMAQPAINAILAKDFIDLKIDIDRATGGKDLRNRYNPSNFGGIPYFVFLDAQGKTLATSNGPGGNIGYPGSPEGIAHFQAMLKAAAVNITAADIAALAASLAEKPEATAAVKH